MPPWAPMPDSLPGWTQQLRGPFMAMVMRMRVMMVARGKKQYIYSIFWVILIILSWKKISSISVVLCASISSENKNVPMLFLFRALLLQNSTHCSRCGWRSITLLCRLGLALYGCKCSWYLRKYSGAAVMHWWYPIQVLLCQCSSVWSQVQLLAC